MADRAIIPLVPAVAGGFILGLIAAALQLTAGPTLTVALVGVVVTLGAGAASVVHAPGDPADRLPVGLLRALLATAVFVLVYIAMIKFLRDGDALLTILLLVVAGLCCGPLVGMRVRDDVQGPDAPRPA